MKTAALAALLGLLAAPTVLADAPVLKDAYSLRHETMENVGKAAGLAAAMLKGEAPFEPRVAQAVFLTMNTAAVGFGLMFPEGSTHPESEAKDTVWSDRAGFEAAVQKFIADSYVAVEAKVADMDAFKAEFGRVASNCKGCHEVYRVAKN